MRGEELESGGARRFLSDPNRSKGMIRKWEKGVRRMGRRF